MTQVETPEKDMHENALSASEGIDIVTLTQQPEWKEMLYSVVKSEKMNPWDIDISLLSQKFMERIREMKKMDFRVPANAILACSILLRFKSDAWTLKEELGILEPIYIPDAIIAEPVFPTLEPMLRVTKRKVNLDELIDAIEDAIFKEKKQASEKRVVVNAIPQPLIYLMKQDGENFEKLLEDVMSRIKSTADSQKMTTFSNLLRRRDADDVVENFVPVLHLANKNEIDMWQEKMFGEIFIQIHSNGNGHANSGNGKKADNAGKSSDN
ncbi:MAG: hypothetical protein QXO69_01895 [archaeon]